MDLLDLLKSYKSGLIGKKKLIRFIQTIKFNEDYSLINNNTFFDNYRKRLTAVPEVIFAKNKSATDLEKIVFNQSSKKNDLLLTKIEKEQVLVLKKKWASVKKIPFPLVFREQGRILHSKLKRLKSKKILLLSGGTSDFPIVEEIRWTLAFLGLKVTCYSDVGVSSLKRILYLKEKIKKAKVIITVAGMEAALPSVVAGLTPAPVIGVPTSVGYGGHFEGLSALLGMLGSCSPGIAVVNIDNGFGAAVLAHKILRN